MTNKIKEIESQNIKNIDKKIIDFIYENGYLIFALGISMITFLIRYHFFTFESSDYTDFLLKWCEYLKNNGGFFGIRSLDSDYNVTYLYALAAFTYLPFSYLYKIKILSTIFDFIGAIGAFLIVKHFYKNTENQNIIPIIAFSIFLLIPTVIMNGSIWGQCDIIYTSFILFSLYFILDKKYLIAFVLYGIAFSLKLQAIFIFPLYIVLYLKKKDFSITNFIMIPLTYFLLFIPALIMGRPINTLWTIYFKQVNEYKSTVLNFPNIYNFLPDDYDLLGKNGVLFTLGIIGILLFAILYLKNNLDDKNIIELALLIVLLVTYFLPAMHERYLFLGDVLSVIYFFVKRQKLIVPIGIIGLSFNSYVIIFGTAAPIPIEMASAFELIIIIVVLIEFLNIPNDAYF